MARESRTGTIANISPRGRLLADSSLQTLIDRWSNLFKTWADEYPRRPGRDLADINAEFTLRKIDPPVELVREAIEALSRKARQGTADLAGNPERFARAAREIGEKMKGFKTMMKGSKH